MYSGEHIRVLRVIKGLSQNDIAKRINVKQQAVSKWEKKKQLDLRIINHFLEATGATHEDLDEIRKLNPSPANE